MIVPQNQRSASFIIFERFSSKDILSHPKSLYGLYHYPLIKYTTKTPQNRSPEESKNLLKLYVLKRMINV